MSIVFNDFLLGDLYWFMRNIGQSVFDFIKVLHDKCRHSKIKEVYDAFAEETVKELWDSREDLNNFLRQPGNIEKYRPEKCSICGTPGDRFIKY